MATRHSSVAGRFYPAGKEDLDASLRGFFEEVKLKRNSRLVIAPHAGYPYSGKLAAIAFSMLSEAETYVLLGPNHTGFGSQISISEADNWETPLGKVKVNLELAEKIARNSKAEFDESAHLQEHSLEVLVPFIQFLKPETKIVPITIAENNLVNLEKLGKAIAKEKNTAVIASSDFTHHEPLEIAKEKDLKAISFIERMDSEGFYEYVQENRISICGAAAIVAGMAFGKEIGLKKGKLLKYATSAESTGDKNSVVGYAAIAFE